MNDLTRRLKGVLKRPSFWLCALGLAAMGLLFGQWLTKNPGYSLYCRLSALLSAGLFCAVCVRFAPEWMRFWRLESGRPAFQSQRTEDKKRHTELLIFVSLLLLDALVLALVYFMRRGMGMRESFAQSLEFWRCLDSGSYLNIAKNWYPTQGETVVQLVFLPGYPVAIRLINWLIGNELYSSLIVSALCFAGAGSMLYRLMRLDDSHEDALRTVKYLALAPGLFFFTAPMSEGLFLLLCLSCLYCARTGKWTLGCVLGGLAAFTRSLGITLLVPLVMELVRRTQLRPGARLNARRLAARAAALLLVAAGLGAYLLINYQISGDPFKFRVYQSTHWGQRLGLFFNTAAYQLAQAIRSRAEQPTTFYGLWLANLLSCLIALLLMIYGAKKMRPSYVAWFIAYFFVAIGATWLLSAPRYLLVMLTLPIALSRLSRSRAMDWTLTALSALSSLVYLYAFVARWQVW